MARPSTFRLPSRRDWAWALLLSGLGVGLGFGLNALHLPRYRQDWRPPTAIDLTVYQAEEESPAAPAPAPTPAAAGGRP